ncbi:SH3 domain-containing protein [Gracilibacillus oryzae]|uniref:SH3 domain-containing protein n=1 Tax=Gracilibacillus oryzae TaxID=1672701 RepID=A0A7C8GU91_9BACI|nr:S-layer homology domain-containing protein [Gracilibacillus oryzae]KAB8138051.1 SH3 domain-containing protein [Gracilibacillus oryzae]
MRKFFTCLLSLSLVLGFLSPRVASAADDLSGHFFEDQIRSLVSKGVFKGYEDGTYRPDKQVSRAEFTSLLVRALDLSANGDTKTFSDVKEGEWYYDAVSIGTSHGFISGYPGGDFKPNDNITRQEMASILHRAATAEGIPYGEKPLTFADNNEINPVFHSSVKFMLHLNIMVGKGGNRFAPKDFTTRGETAAVIVRLLNKKDNPQTIVVEKTHYNYSFADMVNTQMTRTPKADGAGIYIASSAMIEYYANPSNFTQGTSGFFQFLDLSKTAGGDANEINRQILTNKGVLTGQASAFIEAGKKNNVNEIYLIAHALHETGNGASSLAKGIPVDDKGNIVSEEEAEHTVYNVYGYGARDSNPIRGGAKYAFDNKWFTVKDAIIGGATDIANNYINDGQNTLYKMRWNPDSPGYPQYATHVMWATIQSEKMDSMYSLLDNKVLHFDVPAFNNQPGKTSKPTGLAQYFVDTSLAGQIRYTTADYLNFRTGPTTSYDVITQLPEGTKVTIVGHNNVWYKITANGKTGWVHGDYLVTEAKMKQMQAEETPSTEQDPDTEEKDEQTTEDTAEETTDSVDQENGEDTDATEDDSPVRSNNVPLTAEDGNAVVNKDDVVIRSDALEQGYEVIAELQKNAKVNTVFQQGEWYYVTVDGKEGFIHQDELTLQ